MLQIAVHRQDDFTRRMVKACRQRRSLPKVPPQLDHQHAAVHRGYLFQQTVRPVARAVIHKYQLKALADDLHHRLQAVVERRHVLFLVMKGNDDGILRHIPFGRRLPEKVSREVHTPPILVRFPPSRQIFQPKAHPAGFPAM